MATSSSNENTPSSAPPMPVILLLDTSGSMAVDGKIDVLNGAVSEMLAAFAEEEHNHAEVHVAVVTFGGGVTLHVPLTPTKKVSWKALQASGKTPMGAALAIATDLIDDRSLFPSRGYQPALVLVSDGYPNDEWEGPLRRLLDSEPAANTERFALGIGADANHDMLRRFLNDSKKRVFEAHEGREIRNFFRWVTKSETSRSRSIETNQSVEIDDLDEIDDF